MAARERLDKPDDLERYRREAEKLFKDGLVVDIDTKAKMLKALYEGVEDDDIRGNIIGQLSFKSDEEANFAKGDWHDEHAHLQFCQDIDNCLKMLERLLHLFHMHGMRITDKHSLCVELGDYPEIQALRERILLNRGSLRGHMSWRPDRPTRVHPEDIDR